MVQENGLERRASERFAMDFKISIHGIRDGGHAFLEDAVLRDVSGVGVSFLSRMPERYDPGQRLHISIVLPGTDHMQARLEGNATVVRIGQGADGHPFVGVSMDDPLAFVSAVQRAAPADDSEHGD